MADISMCKGNGCSKKEKCYRHTAVQNEYWQTFFLKEPIDEKGECEYFWYNKRLKNG